MATKVGGINPSFTTKLGRGLSCRTGRRGTSTTLQLGNGATCTISQKGKVSICMSVGGMRIKI